VTRDDAWDLLSMRCERLNRDEIAVLADIAERLGIGRSVYGPMCLETDRRDWRAELRAEALDALVYAACDHLCAEIRTAPTEPAPRPPDCDMAECREVEWPRVAATADLVPDAAPTIPSGAPEGLCRGVG
jgi:hypothetical protein